MLLPGDQYTECPPGQEVSQQNCLAAANEVTADMTTIANRDELLVEDWSCECLIEKKAPEVPHLIHSYFSLFNLLHVPSHTMWLLCLQFTISRFRYVLRKQR